MLWCFPFCPDSLVFSGAKSAYQNSLMWAPVFALKAMKQLGATSHIRKCNTRSASQVAAARAADRAGRWICCPISGVAAILNGGHAGFGECSKAKRKGEAGHVWECVLSQPQCSPNSNPIRGDVGDEPAKKDTCFEHVYHRCTAPPAPAALKFILERCRSP
jgi:hypothetical protein